ncbi:MAG: hypothetical protein WAU70_13245, partial [Flavobacteriales bacterium]
VLLLFAVLTALLARAQPSTEWQRVAGGFYQIGVYSSAPDATGHIYTAGFGPGPFDFGSGVTVPSTMNGMVLARYDSLGTINWARALTTTPDELVYIAGIAANSEGDLWVCGYFESATLTLDTIVLTGIEPRVRSFLARFDSTGAVEFATAWGNPLDSDTTPIDLYVDDQDNVLVTGTTFDPNLTVGGLTLTFTEGWEQLYAVKFDASGNGIWGNVSNSPPGGSQGGPNARCITADALGSAYVAGTIMGMLVMDGDTVDADNITAHGILIKLGPTGTVEHMRVMADCDPVDITADDEGNAYVCGIIESEAIFNNDTLVPSAIDGFVAAYDSSGAYRWVIGVSGADDNEWCSSVVLTDPQDAMYVGGTFVLGAWFGDVYMQTGSAPTDGFVMQVDTAGAVTWVKDMTGDGPTVSAEVHFDRLGHLYTSGITQSQTIFLGEPVANVFGNRGFLARFADVITNAPLVEEPVGAPLYPNPCAGSFTLALPSDARTVIIQDVQGRECDRVAVRSSRTSSHHIDVPGIYYATVLSDNARTVQRVIVE